MATQLRISINSASPESFMLDAVLKDYLKPLDRVLFIRLTVSYFKMAYKRFALVAFISILLAIYLK